jgi:hypothetical protein
MVTIAIGLDCILNVIVGGSDHLLQGVDGGFDGGFDRGLFDQFHLAVLGYQPQQSVQQLIWAAFMAISQEGITSYCNSDLTFL